MNIIGIIPSTDKTFEVVGDFSSKDLYEGKLYYDPKDGRVYYYSETETRSNPNTGYFPVWNGRKTYITSFSKEKYFDKDVTRVDIESMASAIDKEIADSIIYQQRKSIDNDILNPVICDGDNMFTQCIKGVIIAKQLTMTDLIDMSKPKIDEKIVENYYSGLIKISFMRPDKWNIWINTILHVSYRVEIFKDNKRLIRYDYPSDKFDTGIVNYDNIINMNIDPFKKIIRILILMENIHKGDLRSEEVDDYTVNNMMTTIGSNNKPLSAQLFSRFIRIAKMKCTVEMYDSDKLIFEYHE